MSYPSLEQRLFQTIIRIVELYIVLYCRLPYRSPANGNTIRCQVKNGTEYVMDFSNGAAMRKVMETCVHTKKISLVDASTLIFTGEVYEKFLWWVMTRKNIEMCISVEYSNVSDIHLSSRSLTGHCEGPKLRITCNPKLEFVTATFKFEDGVVSEPDAVRIRGNRMLKEVCVENWNIGMKRVNGKWDIQTFGECALPNPFTSMDSLDRNCSKFYGTLRTIKGISEIKYDWLSLHKFEVEGCIQIEKTDLKNVFFLNAFSNFRPIPFCSQFIRDNKNLCYGNINYFNTFFKTVTIYNNSEQLCDECTGGEVSKSYLSESAKCSFIHGDLIIANHRGLPSNIGNLHEIEAISGRLIITNNTGLNKFVHLSSLRKVGSRNENGSVIMVRDNADLKHLFLPAMKDIEIKKGESRVELVNNPMLMHVDDEEQMYAKSEGAMTKYNRLKSGMSYNYTIYVGMAVVFFVILLSVLGLFVEPRQKRKKIVLPNPACVLSTKSQEQLIHYCTEIIARNPMVWCVDEFVAIWKQKQLVSEDNTCALSKVDQFVKSHLISIASNSAISKRKCVAEKIHRSRMHEMLAYDWIAMTGPANELTEVLAYLPCNVGNPSVYTDGVIKVAYKLLEVTQLSTKLSCYKYEAEDVNKKKSKEVVLMLYQWPHERLSSECSELLQLFAMLEGKRVICTSARRKEVFSLLHLVYTIVVKAKRPRSVAQTLNLHSCFCNGAPLDRHEVLYAMRFLLYWSIRANCVPLKIEKAHARWCHIYDHMAEYSRKHTNVVSIHPLHLTRLDGVEETKKEVEWAQKQVMNLSERLRKKMQDCFRRRTTEEIQKELICATKSAYGITQSINIPVDADIHSIHSSTLHRTGSIAADSGNVHFEK